jgi:hypothetical protein
VIFSVLYLAVRCLLGCLMVLTRRQASKDSELLVLRHENAVLRRQISRVRYQPGDRLWLAALSALIPRRRWDEVFAVTPATLLAWHRRLVARKWDYTSRRRPGRVSTAATTRKLVIQLASDHLAHGHRRVQGELVRLGQPIAASTVWQILHDAAIGAAPRRTGPTWKKFLTAGLLAAAIEASGGYAQACTADTDADLGEQNLAEMITYIRLYLDCTDICTAPPQSSAARPSGTSAPPGCWWEPARPSARAAAMSASGTPRCRTCRVCAEACRHCDRACRDLLDAWK